MKKKKNLLVLFLGVMLSATVQAANKNQTVTTTLTDSVAITEDRNYIITAQTPFGEGGIVNIVNTDHAVVILEKVKPTAAIKLLKEHVRINGRVAGNGSNCQVKLYNRGTIIMPYPSYIKPLTVFSEKNLTGESANNFGLENTGGFMNTLTDKQLNNRIRSFRLKRGYMVTFSTLPNGRGYSRCFIADDADLEIKTLPNVLDQKISSYRVFKWYDFSKAGLANDTRSETVSALNVQGCYSFGLGADAGVDCECVPHHIYEDWPSPTECGKVTYSPHLKTNNEPGNSADDRPQSVKTILDNWENLMATGLRLCSPSSHDGSLNHLREFMDSIDARGWRCDILDMHCYWPEGSFGNLSGWYNAYKRPIWISEWVWGASWNNNGIFGVATGDNRDNPTAAQLNENKTVLTRILGNLNSWDYVERYFYWNSEANCSKLYYGGKLTPAGEYYASMTTSVGYKKSQDYVPTTPKQKAPSKLTIEPDEATGNARLTWYDANGEYNRYMIVQRKQGSSWVAVDTVEQQEQPGTVTYVDSHSTDGDQYRIRIVSLTGSLLTSPTVTYEAPVYQRTMQHAGAWGTICRPKGLRPMPGVTLYDIAGITLSGRHLCLQPISEAAPGYPCVFYTETEVAKFFELGSEAALEGFGASGLAGSFLGFQLEDGNIMLVDDEWRTFRKADVDVMPKLPAYEAYLYDCDPEFVPRIETWNGTVMRIYGQEDPAGINSVGSSADVPVVYYGLDGIRTAVHPGLLLRKQGGKVSKIVVR